MESYNPVREEGKIRDIHVTHINIRQSISILVFKLILLELLSGVFVIIFHSLIFSTGDYVVFQLRFDLYTMLIYVVLILAKLGLTIFVIIQWIEEYYEINTKTIIHRRGFLFKKEEKYPFEHVRSIKMEQGIFGRIFNYGTVGVYDWDMNKSVSLYLIHNPGRYLKIIQELVPVRDEEHHVLRDQIDED